MVIRFRRAALVGPVVEHGVVVATLALVLEELDVLLTLGTAPVRDDAVATTAAGARWSPARVTV